MKKIMQRFFGVLTSVALLVTSAMPVFAASADGHDHGAGLTQLNKGHETEKGSNYTITLSYPKVDDVVDPSKYQFDKTNSHFGAFQIFSGTVKGTPDYTNPGTTGKEIPITDIKWGNAFGKVGDSNTKQNIIEFVYALAKAPTGPYDYAFSDFKDFEKFFSGNTLNSDYGTDVTVTVDASGKVTKVENVDSVDFDKLAVAVADILANPVHANDHEWLQAFTDILGGFAAKETGDSDDEAYHNKNYATQYYEGFVGTGSSEQEKSDSYTIYVPAGYYMIRDLSSIGSAEVSHAFSARMLFVADNVKQILKVDVPRLDKEILRGSDTVGSTGNETEVAGVGDVVHFQLHGTLPSNYDEYLGGYQYKFIDTLSKGLDLVQYEDKTALDTTDAKDCIKVTVKGLFKYDESAKDWVWEEKTIKLDTKIYDHSSTPSSGSDPSDKHLGSDSGQKNYNYNATYEDKTLTVEFPCLKEIRIQDGGNVYRLGYNTDKQFSEIYVDYYAKVNQNAVVSPEDATGNNGNYNQAQIEYSDNPQASGDTDKTTVDSATVYIFGLDIIKIDAAEYLRTGKITGSTALKDAKFALVRPVKEDDSITGWEIAKFEKVNGILSEPETLPEMFKLFGYYSIVSWENITLTGSSGVSKFDPEWLKDIKYNTDEYKIATLQDGILNVSGLDAGVTYTMVETDAPADYATIPPFTITLTAETDPDNTDEYTGKLSGATSDRGIAEGGSFSYENPVDITDTFPDDNGSANMLVANFKYIDLPSTGGVGTYLFYIIGGGIIVLSAVLFILSKKKTTK